MALFAVEKALKKQSLPRIDAIERLAQFWDTHDLTDFEHELEEIKGPVFARREKISVVIDLPAREARRVKKIARSRGLEESTMLKNGFLREFIGLRSRHVRLGMVREGRSAGLALGDTTRLSREHVIRYSIWPKPRQGPQH